MNADPSIAASAYAAALSGAGITHFVTVPDFVQLSLHQQVENGNSGMKLVRTCNEDQAVCVAAGLSIAGQRPIIVIQNQGLYACINTIRAVALDARIPTLFLIGQFGRETANFGKPSTESSRRTVNLLEPVLDAIGVPHWGIETEADLAAIPTALDSALGRRGASALVVGRPIGWN
jgi:sulfopyruvate decarboxylase TPP-binding subunit